MSGSLIAQKKYVAHDDSVETVVQAVKDYSEEDNLFSKLVKSILVQDDELVHTIALDPDRKKIRQYTGTSILKFLTCLAGLSIIQKILSAVGWKRQEIPSI